MPSHSYKGGHSHSCYYAIDCASVTCVVTLNFGGCSMCFLTLHNSAERMSESRYFSGKVGGTWISMSIVSTMPVAGLVWLRCRIWIPSVGRLRCLQKPRT